MRIGLQRDHQLVVSRRVLTLFAQLIGLRDNETVTQIGQRRRRRAGLNFRILQERLRFVAKPGLIQHSDLIGVIPGVTFHAVAHVLAHQLHRQRKLPGGGQIFRQRTHVSRCCWRVLRQRAQGIGSGRAVALLQIVFGIGHLRIEVGALRQFTHTLILTAARNAREQGAGGGPVFGFRRE